MGVIVVHNDFEQLAARLQDEARDVVEDTSNEIADAMKAATSQRIASTITIRRMNAGRTATVLAGNKKSAMHAAFVEYGTVDLAAQPFATPAADSARSGFDRKMRTLLDRGL